MSRRIILMFQVGFAPLITFELDPVEPLRILLAVSTTKARNSHSGAIYFPRSAPTHCTDFDNSIRTFGTGAEMITLFSPFLRP